MLEGAPPDLDDPNLRPPRDADRLDALTAMLRRARQLALEAEDLETRRRAANAELNDLIHTKLPDLFQQTHTTVHAVAPEGNLPGYEGRLKPYHKANISAEWEPERREAGYAALRVMGGADLVRNVVTVEFDRGDDAFADELVSGISKLCARWGSGVVSRGQSVPWSSLTAWVREQCTKLHREFTREQLEAIGAVVGHVVEVKQVRS